MATLLPNGEQTFTDSNGVPLNAGTVEMYVPGTLTPKDTWQNAGQTVLNTNPIDLDAAGRAVIYGSGTYRQIVKDAAGNTIWDQLTAETAAGGTVWGGTSSGTPNAQTISAASFNGTDGQIVSFLVGLGLTNTSQVTITPSGGSPVPLLKDTTTGPTPLTGGELVAGNAVQMIYDLARGAFHLVETPLAGAALKDVTVDGLTVTTSFTATGLVINADLADMAQQTFKGRASGAGTGVPVDLSATQATASLNAMVGDSGSGGTKGLAPAPSAGDAAANKFLHASGAFVAAQPTPSSSTLGVGTLIAAENTTAGTIANGGTIAGSNLRPISLNSSSSVVFGGTLTGTWTNVNGATVGVQAGGLFVRTA